MDWSSLESRPGSFSKNFGWKARPGLKLLHEVINSIFGNLLQPVSRQAARSIILENFNGDPLVPLNFFLYNKIIEGESVIVPDQLVLQALAEDHSRSFDYLAISALNFSRVGRWSSARPFQTHPAPWARSFVIDVLYKDGRWHPSKLDADTIESFLDVHLAHRGDNTRKFATNLSFLYRHSGMLELHSSETEDWWGAALFLFLDRAILDLEINIEDETDDILSFLDQEEFWALTAVERDSAHFAAAGLINEYKDLGGITRLDHAPKDEETAKAKPADGSTAQAKKRHAAKLRQPQDLGLTPVQRIFVQAQRQARNRSNVVFLKALYDDQCAVCGAKLEVDSRHTTYSEAGHIKPIGKPINGPDHLANLLLFCPNHHKAFDRGGIWIDPTQGSGIVRSSTNDQSFDQRVLEIHARHEFDLQYTEWHAQYFGHL